MGDICKVESDQVRIAIKFVFASNQPYCYAHSNAPLACLIGIDRLKAINAVKQSHGIEFGSLTTNVI
jgi:hypothetical protein